ncbi:hypothetical protein V6N13_146926 [Hibiscus sabdariffa]|uniref:Uncharacterized protein n=1 Tax=Hibiscus sabdariffa TaxID=183260 RepID=A0ABR2TUG0_9ROSI
MGLKKGAWAPEEDQILINYIHLHGHGNWRALPKQAGLLRCGKSCRLRWTNYLRPDIKRGNFSREEEDTIITLHEMFGNKWSAIAARLRGRTDNEIKNLWHTHLKKRLLKPQQPTDSSKHIQNEQQSSSEASTLTTSENNSNGTTTVKTETDEDGVSEIDENFWSQVLSADNSGMAADLQVGVASDPQTRPYFTSSSPLAALEVVNDYGSSVYDADANMDFWYNHFTRAPDSPELPEF